METIINKYDDYLKWLAGADHELTVADLVNLRGYLFSPEADEIHATAATVLGATA